MVGVAAVAVVVVAITAGSGEKSAAPPRPSAPVESPAPNQPLSGFGFSAVEDPSAHQLVLFGGVDSYDTTWLWDGHRWALAHPPVNPPGRFGAAAAYDPLTRVVMLYGGRLGPGDVVDDTWAWDGRTWTELDSGKGSPPAGEGSRMAWDDILNEMVLVNGGGSSGGETWLCNGNHWVRQPRGDLPAGTFVGGMAVDPLTRALLAASAPGQGRASTWEWDGTAWREVSTRTNPPAFVGLVLDPASDRLILWGDPAVGAGRQMWSWSGQDWIPLAGTGLPVSPEAEVTDTNGGHVLILGSLVQASQGAPQPIDLWSWSGSTWNQLA
jgi:hypothetical protein